MTNELFYIFLGEDVYEDYNCFLCLSETLNKYFVDDREEGYHVKTKFTKSEFEEVKSKLPNLMLEDESLIPVGDLDE